MGTLKFIDIIIKLTITIKSTYVIMWLHIFKRKKMNNHCSIFTALTEKK